MCAYLSHVHALLSCPKPGQLLNEMINVPVQGRLLLLERSRVEGGGEHLAHSAVLFYVRIGGNPRVLAAYMLKVRLDKCRPLFGAAHEDILNEVSLGDVEGVEAFDGRFTDCGFWPHEDNFIRRNSNDIA